MILACARRTVDGLLSWADASEEAPNPTAVRQNAVNALGGVLDDWVYIELTPQQYVLVTNAMPGRSYLWDDILESRPVPRLNSNKAQIEDGGLDTATLTFDVLNASYADIVQWKVTAPDGTVQMLTKPAEAGVSTLEVVSHITGSITIEAEADSFGSARLEIEGV